MKKICPVCNKEFSVPPSLDRIKCCSRNCSNISKRGKKLSFQHCKKLSLIAKQNGFGKWMIGKKASLKTKLKMRKSSVHYWKGKELSLQHRKKLSVSHRNKISHWKGGEVFINGYIYIKNRTHPLRTKNNYVMRSHLVMEKHLRRYLLPTEIVHHINGVKDDDRIENLYLFPSIKAHRRFHANPYPLKSAKTI